MSVGAGDCGSTAGLGSTGLVSGGVDFDALGEFGGDLAGDVFTGVAFGGDVFVED
jgi:hypothetical protein